jgi:hypothetical protein
VTTRYVTTPPAKVSQDSADKQAVESCKRWTARALASVATAALGLCWADGMGNGAPGSPPPGQQPVSVAMTAHLLSLTGFDERTKTFDADTYVALEWNDSRLANPARSAVAAFYADDAAELKLREIWWPHLEFVNTGMPSVTNRALTVFPNGRVQYVMGITSAYRSDLDLRRFPFDRQVLQIRMKSFQFQDNVVVLRDAGNNRETVDRNTLEDLQVSEIRSYVHTVPGLGLTTDGKNTRYSEYVLEFKTVRASGYYVIAVIVPMLFVTLVSFLIYFIEPNFVFGRTNILLGCLVAFVATQFAVKSNLPHVPYATVIDRLTLANYGWLSVGLVETVLIGSNWKNQTAQLQKIDQLCARWLPALFAITTGVLLLV